MCNYERTFRASLGFTNQEKFKKYFKATDIVVVNWDKINQCNARLKEICEKINHTISEDIQKTDINCFTNKISEAFENTDVLTINPEWFVWKLANPLPELDTVITSI